MNSEYTFTPLNRFHIVISCVINFCKEVGTLSQSNLSTKSNHTPGLQVWCNVKHSLSEAYLSFNKSSVNTIKPHVMCATQKLLLYVTFKILYITKKFFYHYISYVISMIISHHPKYSSTCPLNATPNLQYSSTSKDAV